MNTFAKIAASLLLAVAVAPAVFAQTAPAAAPPAVSATSKMSPKTSAGRKGGYVKATTIMTKSGKMVHRKGYYRHSTKTKPGKAVPVTATPSTGKM